MPIALRGDANRFMAAMKERLGKFKLTLAAFTTWVKELKYITMVRIHAACQALADGRMRISDIALNNGFYDLSHFNRQFRKEMLMSPSDYRKKSVGASRLPNLRGLGVG